MSIQKAIDLCLSASLLTASTLGFLSLITPAAADVFDLYVVGYERKITGDFFNGYRYTESYDLASGAQSFVWEPGERITMRINAPAGQAFSYQPSLVAPPTPPFGGPVFISGLGSIGVNLFAQGPGLIIDEPSFFDDPTHSFYFGQSEFSPSPAENLTLIGGYYSANASTGGLVYVFQATGGETPFLFTSLEFTAIAPITLSGSLRFTGAAEGEYPFLTSQLEVGFFGLPEEYVEGAPSFLLVPVPEPSATAAWLGLAAALAACKRRRLRP